MEDYEIWFEEGSVTMATSKSISDLKAKGMIGASATMLHAFSASTPEEAHAIRNLRMGFEPYTPVGNAQPCPNVCGSYFYPDGSGICPKCRKVC